MPELPEVETIKKGLEKVIIGKKIIKFEARDKKVVRFVADEIEGEEIVGIERRAKILVFRLTKKEGCHGARRLAMTKNAKADSSDINNKIMLIHLKMTGQLIWEKCLGEKEHCLKKSRSTPFDSAQGGSLATSRVEGGHPSSDWVSKLPNVYTRAIFHFEDGSVLFFNDLRRFGYLKLYQNLSLYDLEEIKKLGPEPFDSRLRQTSKEFDENYLMRRALKLPKRKIKQFLTDQEIISGVGNIYADEALYWAGILPTRLVKDIKISEWRKIIASVKKALELGIKYGGSSEDTYVDAFGNQGTMGEYMMVYRRTGQECKVCGTKVVRIELGGRGTHFCPKCQI